MTETTFPDADNLKIEIRKIGPVWYAHVPQSALWARADSLEAAVAHLNERHVQYAAFVKETGAPPLDLLIARPARQKLWSGIGRTARLVAIIALCAIPISYALSTGIERGVEAAAKDLRLRGLFSQLETAIIELSRPENDLPPERAKALSQAVERIIERLQPFTAPAARLFQPHDASGPTDEPARAPSGAAN